MIYWRRNEKVCGSSGPSTMVPSAKLVDVVPSDLQPALSKTLDLSSACAGNHKRAVIAKERKGGGQQQQHL